MTTLERASDLYAALVLENKPGDARAVHFRTWLVQHYQLEGMKAADAIDKAQREGNLSIPERKAEKPQKTSAPAFAEGVDPVELPDNSAPKYRKFMHPLEGMGKSKPSQFRKLGATQTVQQVNLPDTTDTKSKGTQASTTATEKGKAANPADKEKGGKKGKVKNTLNSREIEDLLDMQPSAIQQHFDKETIAAILDKQGVQYNSAASHRQLAATLLGYYRRKND